MNCGLQIVEIDLPADGACPEVDSTEGQINADKIKKKSVKSTQSVDKKIFESLWSNRLQDKLGGST